MTQCTICLESSSSPSPSSVCANRPYFRKSVTGYYFCPFILFTLRKVQMPTWPLRNTHVELASLSKSISLRGSKVFPFSLQLRVAWFALECPVLSQAPFLAPSPNSVPCQAFYTEEWQFPFYMSEPYYFFHLVRGHFRQQSAQRKTLLQKKKKKNILGTSKWECDTMSIVFNILRLEITNIVENIHMYVYIYLSIYVWMYVCMMSVYMCTRCICGERESGVCMRAYDWIDGCIYWMRIYRAC